MTLREFEKLTHEEQRQYYISRRRPTFELIESMNIKDGTVTKRYYAKLGIIKVTMHGESAKCWYDTEEEAISEAKNFQNHMKTVNFKKDNDKTRNAFDKANTTALLRIYEINKELATSLFQ